MIRKRTISWTTISTNRWNLPTRLILLNKSLEASILKKVYNTLAWTAPTGSFDLNAEGPEQVSRNYLDHSMEMCMEWFVRGASMECTYVTYVKHASWLTCVTWIAYQRNSVYWKLLSFHPKVGNLFLWGRSSGRRIKHTHLGVMKWPADARSCMRKRFWFSFSPSLVGLAIESQCRRSFRLLFLQRID